jgi:hypothetical protein
VFDLEPGSVNCDSARKPFFFSSIRWQFSPTGQFTVPIQFSVATGQSMVEIAKSNGVGKQYVGRLIRLAFLAPEMVERIVAGRQPPELTTQSLQAGRFDIPVGWAAQKRALGFAQPA